MQKNLNTASAHATCKLLCVDKSQTCMQESLQLYSVPRARQMEQISVSVLAWGTVSFYSRGSPLECVHLLLLLLSSSSSQQSTCTGVISEESLVHLCWLLGALWQKFNVSLTEPNRQLKIDLVVYLSYWPTGPFVMVAESRVSRVSSVATTTRYGLDGPGIEFRWGRSVRTRQDRPWGPPSLL